MSRLPLTDGCVNEITNAQESATLLLPTYLKELQRYWAGVFSKRSQSPMWPSARISPKRALES